MGLFPNVALKPNLRQASKVPRIEWDKWRSRRVGAENLGQRVGAHFRASQCVPIHQIWRYWDLTSTVPDYHSRGQQVSPVDFHGPARQILDAGPKRQEDNTMLRLVQSVPITATSVPCPQCGEAMDIKWIEPHPATCEKENHVFECGECGLPRTYAVKLP